MLSNIRGMFMACDLTDYFFMLLTLLLLGIYIYDAILGFKLRLRMWLRPRCVHRNYGKMRLQLRSRFGFGDLQNQNVTASIAVAGLYFKTFYVL